MEETINVLRNKWALLPVNYSAGIFWCDHGSENSNVAKINCSDVCVLGFMSYNYFSNQVALMPSYVSYFL